MLSVAKWQHVKPYCSKCICTCQPNNYMYTQETKCQNLHLILLNKKNKFKIFKTNIFGHRFHTPVPLSHSVISTQTIILTKQIHIGNNTKKKKKKKNKSQNGQFSYFNIIKIQKKNLVL